MSENPAEPTILEYDVYPPYHAADQAERLLYHAAVGLRLANYDRGRTIDGYLSSEAAFVFRALAGILKNRTRYEEARANIRYFTDEGQDEPQSALQLAVHEAKAGHYSDRLEEFGMAWDWLRGLPACAAIAAHTMETYVAFMDADPYGYESTTAPGSRAHGRMMQERTQDFANILAYQTGDITRLTRWQFMRHTETGVALSAPEQPLSAEGKETATIAGADILEHNCTFPYRPISNIVHSDMARAAQTAHYAGPIAGISELHMKPTTALQERKFDATSILKIPAAASDPNVINTLIGHTLLLLHTASSGEDHLMVGLRDPVTGEIMMESPLALMQQCKTDAAELAGILGQTPEHTLLVSHSTKMRVLAGELDPLSGRTPFAERINNPAGIDYGCRVTYPSPTPFTQALRNRGIHLTPAEPANVRDLIYGTDWERSLSDLQAWTHLHGIGIRSYSPIRGESEYMRRVTDRASNLVYTIRGFSYCSTVYEVEMGIHTRQVSIEVVDHTGSRPAVMYAVTKLPGRIGTLHLNPAYYQQLRGAAAIPVPPPFNTFTDEAPFISARLPGPNGPDDQRGDYYYIFALLDTPEGSLEVDERFLQACGVPPRWARSQAALQRLFMETIYAARKAIGLQPGKHYKSVPISGHPGAELAEDPAAPRRGS